jgi:hypothetical protein
MLYSIAAVERMAPSDFGKFLNDVYARPRTDVSPYGAYGNPTMVRNSQPVTVEKALKWLGVSQGQMVGLLRSGDLPAPAHQDDGEPIWRWDDIAELADRLERVREDAR